MLLATQRGGGGQRGGMCRVLLERRFDWKKKMMRMILAPITLDTGPDWLLGTQDYKSGVLLLLSDVSSNAILSFCPCEEKVAFEASSPGFQNSGVKFKKKAGCVMNDNFMLALTGLTLQFSICSDLIYSTGPLGAAAEWVRSCTCWPYAVTLAKPLTFLHSLWRHPADVTRSKIPNVSSGHFKLAMQSSGPRTSTPFHLTLHNWTGHMVFPS